MISDSHQRVMNELTKSDSNDQKSVIKENLAQRERVLNENLQRLQYDEERVSEKQK